MLAGFLQSAGLFVGDELLGANEGNEKGHFEDVAFLRLHEQALAQLGRDPHGWTLDTFDSLPAACAENAAAILSKNMQYGQWGWKDPRTCLFLDYWATKLPQSNYVFIFRPPWEVADSLFRRGDKAFAADPEFALLIWQKYNQTILDFCSRYPQRSLLLSIAELVRSPVELLSQLNAKFGLALKQSVSLDHDPSLLNQRSRQHQKFVKECLPDVYAVWEQLENMSWRGGQVDLQQTLALPDAGKDFYLRNWLAVGKTHEKLNDWKRWHRQTLTECMRLQAENDDLRRQLFDTQTSVNQLEFRLSAIGNSKVWRIRNQCAVILGKSPV